MKKTKICFAASSGGHFEQISMLRPLMSKYESFVVTEHTEYKATIKDEKMYYVHQVNRKEMSFPFWMVVNALKSIIIFLREKPDVVITTGVLAMIPLCLIAKLFGKKLIYIESFAKVSSPTETGRFLYKFADRFYSPIAKPAKDHLQGCRRNHHWQLRHDAVPWRQGKLHPQGDF